MERTAGLQLSKFAKTPHSLRLIPSIDSPATTTIVDLGVLYHHYYLDSYGCRPPNPDPSRFEYLETLAPGTGFLFRGRGPGTNPGKRRTISSDLGQAFFRWFCHEHLGMTYFAHMQDVLERPTHPAFGGLQVKRTQGGDAPDYLCACRFDRPIIGEAKGRYGAISFSSAEFQGWRDQFSRIALFSPDDAQISLKGYIVATRHATEQNKLPMSQIHAEDPETPGGEWSDGLPPLWRGVAALHYANHLSRLGLTLFSDALRRGYAVAPEIRFGVGMWACGIPPLQNRVFAGGYFSRTEVAWRETNGLKFFIPSIVQLGQPNPVFFGVELKNFTAVVDAGRGGWSALDALEDFEVETPEGRPSNLTWTRDGAVLGPLEYFVQVGEQLF